MIDITIIIIQPAKYSTCLQLDDLDYEVLSFIALNWAKKKKKKLQKFLYLQNCC